MIRWVVGIVRKFDKILIGRIARMETLIPKMRWFFPYFELPEDESPRRWIKKKLGEIGIDASINKFLFKARPTENPNIEQIFYLLDYKSGVPKSYEKLDHYMWVRPTETFKYFTTTFPKNLSDFLHELEAGLV